MGNLRTATARGHEDLQHVEILQTHLVGNSGWIPDSRCCERGSKGGARYDLGGITHACRGLDRYLEDPYFFGS